MAKHLLENDVVFRIGRNGEVIALWPARDAGWARGQFCQSYLHIGQHGTADYHQVIRQTRPAQYVEYANLCLELVERGYKNLNVICRARREHHNQRRNPQLEN